MISGYVGIERIGADENFTVVPNTDGDLHLETGEEEGKIDLWMQYPSADPDDKKPVTVPPNHRVDVIDHGAEGFTVIIRPK